MTQTSAFSLDFAAATDIGCHRGNNEDSFGYDAEQHLYVVCDGMGGSAAGEVASGMAVRVLIETFETLATQATESEDALPLEKRLIQSILEANRQVREASAANPELHNMGTTLVCACLDTTSPPSNASSDALPRPLPRLVIGNVGDSRAYLIRGGTCTQVTLDHSLLEEQLRMGLITQAMADASNLKSVITRAIGAADVVEPDLFAAELQLGDMLLLTSDGLTRYAEAEFIAQTASTQLELSAICHALIDHAKHSGGVDNITCMMLRVVETPALEPVTFTADPLPELVSGEVTEKITD